MQSGRFASSFECKASALLLGKVILPGKYLDIPLAGALLFSFECKIVHTDSLLLGIPLELICETYFQKEQINKVGKALAIYTSTVGLQTAPSKFQTLSPGDV